MSRYFKNTLVMPSYRTVHRLVLYDNKTEYHPVDQKDKRSKQISATKIQYDNPKGMELICY